MVLHMKGCTTKLRLPSPSHEPFTSFPPRSPLTRTTGWCARRTKACARKQATTVTVPSQSSATVKRSGNMSDKGSGSTTANASRTRGMYPLSRINNASLKLKCGYSTPHTPRKTTVVHENGQDIIVISDSEEDDKGLDKSVAWSRQLHPSNILLQRPPSTFEHGLQTGRRRGCPIVVRRSPHHAYLIRVRLTYHSASRTKLKRTGRVSSTIPFVVACGALC